METQTLAINSLLLDPLNPRHDAVSTQRETMLSLIDEQGAKLTALARSIADKGLSPLERVLVIKQSGKYVVVEGNRRVAAVKLLNKPTLAAGTDLEGPFKTLAKSSAVPSTVDCVVLPSRDAAKPWMVLRHTGEQEGAGVVSWLPLQRERFHAKPGSQAAKAVAFVDAVASAYPRNAQIQDSLDSITSNRLTTLGRLVADPNFMTHVGFEDDNGTLVSHYPGKELEPILERILGDVATHVSVTQLKTKDMRAHYLAQVPKPKATAYRADAKPLASGGPSTGTRPTTVPTRRTAKPGSPFKALDLQKLGPRIDDIVQELRRLDITKSPNAAAIMTRVVLELSVDAYIDTRGLATNGEVKNRIKRALHDVDPTDADPKYQGVRAGLNDGTSMMAVATLHGYVHNPNFHPGPADVRSIVSNLKPFLQAMNDRV